jgi:hypothetical protein
MSHFEYIVEVPVDDKVENKTKELISYIDRFGFTPQFNLVEYVDRDNKNDSKTRVFTIIGYSNVNQIMTQLFYGFATKISCHHKTPVAVW